MTDTTQPPAEPLAEAQEIAIHFALPGMYDGISTHATRRGDADDKPYMRAILAALTRRAGGDAIPAGWQSIGTAPRDGTWFIADGGGLDRPTPIKWCARVGAWEADAVMLEDWDDQAEGYSRPLFWWAIPERRPATPKPPGEWKSIEQRARDAEERLAALALPAPVVEGELQEIADGAYGDGPAVRGAARDQLAALSEGRSHG